MGLVMLPCQVHTPLTRRATDMDSANTGHQAHTDTGAGLTEVVSIGCEHNKLVAVVNLEPKHGDIHPGLEQRHL